MTREAVVDAAEQLTRIHGLEGWTTRQLLAEVSTSFSVVYRLVGDREALSAAVADRVVAAIPIADPALPWKVWVTEELLATRVCLLEYPGVAQWLVTRGGTPSVVPHVETALAVLTQAGFGDEAVTAWTFVFLSTVMLIVLSDFRKPATDNQPSPISHAAMLERLDAIPGFEERIAAMRALIRDLSGEQHDQTVQEGFEYALARSLAGLDVRLEELTQQNGGPDTT